MKISRLGVDLAKNVIQLHGVDESERAVIRKRLSRGKFLAFMARLTPCVVGMEACAGAHHWGRELQKLGHEVRLMPPQFVAPYRKNEKNDGNDAEACCEAMSRPTMRFVAVKSVAQQAMMMVHGGRQLRVRQRTALANQIRGYLAEFGLVVAQGVNRVRQALPQVLEDGENGMPGMARERFAELYERLVELDEQVKDYDRQIEEMVRESKMARLLMTIPGVGAKTATAVVAAVGERAAGFANARQFVAWLGLVAKQHSSGETTRHGRISKRGNSYLRTLFVHGARSEMRFLDRRDDAKSRWARQLCERRGYNRATVGLAAKHARIVWALLTTGQAYRSAPSATR